MYWMTKALSVLILPPALLVFVMLAAMALLAAGRQRMAMALLGVTAGVLYLLSISPTMDALMAPLEGRYPYPAREQLVCDAIVVTGGGLTGRAGAEGGRPALSPSSAERIAATYQLWRQLRVPILLSGGDSWDFQTPEASAMAEALLALGVPESALVLEWWSRNTYENAQNAQAVASTFGWGPLCLVTSAFHLPRSVRAFRAAQLSVVPIPAGGWTSAGGYTWTGFVPALDHLQGSTLALREYLALAWYRLMYGI
jgi:uncharacterized SAM-binding protein YcdF (DUF218 family)